MSDDLMEDTIQTAMNDFQNKLMDQQRAVRNIRDQAERNQASERVSVDLTYLQGWLDALSYAYNVHNRMSQQVDTALDHHDCGDDSTTTSGKKGESIER